MDGHCRHRQIIANDIVILFQRVVSMKSNVTVTPPRLPGLIVNDSLVNVILK